MLFFLADKVYGLSHDMIRIYAGHLSIFLTRARGPFWSRSAPAPILLAAVIGTQAIATLIAVYGAAMTPLGWRWAGLVWAHSVLWFLFNDRLKLLTTGSTTTRAAKT